MKFKLDNENKKKLVTESDQQTENAPSFDEAALPPQDPTGSDPGKSRPAENQNANNDVAPSLVPETAASSDLSPCAMAADKIDSSNIRQCDQPMLSNCSRGDTETATSMQPPLIHRVEAQGDNEKNSAAPVSDDVRHRGNERKTALRRSLPILLFFAGMLALAAIGALGNSMAWDRYTRAGAVAILEHDIPRAKRCFTKALAEARKFPNGGDSRTADSLQSLASIYKKQGQLDQAEKMALEALQIRMRLFGANSQSIPASYCALAEVYNAKHDTVKVITCYESALAAAKRAKSSPDEIASILMNMAAVRGQDDLQSIKLYTEILGIALTGPNFNFSQLQQTSCALGSLLQRGHVKKEVFNSWMKEIDATGRNGQEMVRMILQNIVDRMQPGDLKEQLYERLARSWQKQLSVKSNEAVLYNRDAFLKWAQSGDSDLNDDGFAWERLTYGSKKSVQIFKQELAMVQGYFGNQHPAVALILSDLARCKSLPSLEREACCRRSMKIWEEYLHEHSAEFTNYTSEVHTAEGFEVSASIHDNFSTLKKLSDRSKWKLIDEEELNLWKTSISKDSPKMAEVYLYLAENSSPEDCEKYFQKSLQLMEHVLKANADDSENYGKRVEYVQFLFSSWRSVDSANPVKIRENEVAIIERVCGPDSIYLALAINDLLGEYSAPSARAVELCNKAVKIWQTNIKHCNGPYRRSEALNEFGEYDVDQTFDAWKRSVRGENKLSIEDREIQFWKEGKGTKSRPYAQALYRKAFDPQLPRAVSRACCFELLSIWESEAPTNPSFGHSNDMESLFNHLADISPKSETAQLYRRQLAFYKRLPFVKLSDRVAAQLRVARYSNDPGEARSCLSDAAHETIRAVLNDSDVTSFQSLMEDALQLSKELAPNMVPSIIDASIRKWQPGRTYLEIACKLDAVGRFSDLPAGLRQSLLEQSIHCWEQCHDLDALYLSEAQRTFNLLGALYRAIGIRSEPILARSVELCKRHTNAESISTAIALGRLAFAIEQDYMESAELLPPAKHALSKQLYSESLALWRRHLGGKLTGARSGDHSEILLTLWGLARLSDAREARALYLEAFAADCHKKFLHDLKDLISIKLCSSCMLSQDLKKAQDIYRKMQLGQSDPKGVDRLQLMLKARNSAASAHRDYSTYMNWVNAQLGRRWSLKQCPPTSLQLNFTVGQNGELSRVNVTNPSRSFEFDADCLEGLEEAAPFLPLPDKNRQSITIDYAFNIQ